MKKTAIAFSICLGLVGSQAHAIDIELPTSCHADDSLLATATHIQNRLQRLEQIRPLDQEKLVSELDNRTQRSVEIGDKGRAECLAGISIQVARIDSTNINYRANGITDTMAKKALRHYLKDRRLVQKVRECVTQGRGSAASRSETVDVTTLSPAQQYLFVLSQQFGLHEECSNPEFWVNLTDEEAIDSKLRDIIRDSFRIGRDVAETATAEQLVNAIAALQATNTDDHADRDELIGGYIEGRITMKELVDLGSPDAYSTSSDGQIDSLTVSGGSTGSGTNAPEDGSVYPGHAMDDALNLEEPAAGGGNGRQNSQGGTGDDERENELEGQRPGIDTSSSGGAPDAENAGQESQDGDTTTLNITHDQDGDGFTLTFTGDDGSDVSIHYTDDDDDGLWESDCGGYTYTGELPAEGAHEYTPLSGRRVQISTSSNEEDDQDEADQDDDSSSYEDPTQDDVLAPIVTVKPTNTMGGCDTEEGRHEGQVPADKLNRREVNWASMPNPLGGGPIMVSTKVPSLIGGCSPDGIGSGGSSTDGPDSRGPIRGTDGTRHDDPDNS